LGITEAMGSECVAAPSIATGFGAGIARHGEICGAVVGGVMAIGVLRGRRDPVDEAAKTATYSAVTDLIRGFRKEHGTLSCRELTGCDMQTEEGAKKAASLNLHQNVCPKFVALAAELAARALDPRHAGP
jgi:C_GCAxxG_C_C family probable redox protein